VIDGRGLGTCETSEIANYEALNYLMPGATLQWSAQSPAMEPSFGIASELATALQYLRTDTADRYI
jgi:hypothetical protein